MSLPSAIAWYEISGFVPLWYDETFAEHVYYKHAMLIKAMNYL